MVKEHKMLNGIIIHMNGSVQMIGDIDFIALEYYLNQLTPIVHEQAQEQRRKQLAEIMQSLRTDEDVHSLSDEH
jgi:hypothetical protein